MKTFGALNPNDYTIEEFYASTPISWELVSGSTGIPVVTATELEGAVTINRANNALDTLAINKDTGIYEYLLHASVKHLFYDRGQFVSASRIVTSSVAALQDRIFVVSVGQNFYGDRIKPGTFEVTVDTDPLIIRDDYYGNLYVSQSGTGSYVGNIFYNNGIAVITEYSGSSIGAISSGGLAIKNNTSVYVDYYSDTKVTRHQVNVKLNPYEFNFSPFNPTVTSKYIATGSATASLVAAGIPSSSTTSSAWDLYKLMSYDLIKPYITSVGLYNEKYELLAVAKFSTPIQRTFNTNQIFIVRFDT